jgi:hypothetical protein
MTICVADTTRNLLKNALKIESVKNGSYQNALGAISGGMVRVLGP